MAYTQIRSERRGRVGWITLDRPQFRNAQSRVLLEELDDAFSSGHDLGTPEEKEDATRRPWAEGVRGQLERTWDLHVEKSLRWRDLPKPTIAAVQGYCIFGGYLVASVMDLIVAAEDARFLPAHVQLFNQAQDAMGFRTSAHAAHSNFMVLASGGVIRKDGEGERRLTGVGRALAEEPPRER